MDELTRVALLGTSRYSGPIPTGDHAAASLVPGAAIADREESLLLACGSQAVYALAGRLAESAAQPAVPAPKETKKLPSPKLAALLANAISDQASPLLLEFLRLMDERGVVVPPELLPRLLDSRDAQLHARLTPVLGERGQWLCLLNPDWTHFVKDAVDRPVADTEALKRMWDEGTIEERCRAIETLRKLDPARARDWLEEGLPNEKHGTRMKLLKALETGLEASDEPFLERLLDDRSAGIGQIAASFLCKLPGSALAERMRQRAAVLITIEKTGLVQNKAKLVCTPPSELPPDWERDGFKKKAAGGEGLRASWAEHLVASLPLSFWMTQLDLEPKELIAGVADDPFASSVIAGWKSSVRNFAQAETAPPEWLDALWQYDSEALANVEDQATAVEAIHRRDTTILMMEPILHAMAQHSAEAALTNALKPAAGWRDGEALRLLARWTRPWSVRFATWFLSTARSRLEQHSNDSAHRWALALSANAGTIPAGVLALALDPWKTPGIDQSASWLSVAIRKEIQKFTTLVEQRQAFQQELDAHDQPSPEP